MSVSPVVSLRGAARFRAYVRPRMRRCSIRQAGPAHQSQATPQSSYKDAVPKCAFRLLPKRDQATESVAVITLCLDLSALRLDL